jgi:hypothetical protein
MRLVLWHPNMKGRRATPNFALEPEISRLWSWLLLSTSSVSLPHPSLDLLNSEMIESRAFVATIQMILEQSTGLRLRRSTYLPSHQLDFILKREKIKPSSKRISRECQTSFEDFSNSSNSTIALFPDIAHRKLFKGEPTSWPIKGARGPNRSVSYFISVISIV